MLSLIARPKVLIVVAHPAIGAGLETLLQLEDRYDVRRVTDLVDVYGIATRWPADIVLLDAQMVAGPMTIGVPVLVLAGDAVEGLAVARKLAGSVGWLPKDAAPADLVKAIERVVGRRAAPQPSAATHARATAPATEPMPPAVAAPVVFSPARTAALSLAAFGQLVTLVWLVAILLS